MKRSMDGNIGKKMVKVFETVALIRLITRLPKHEEDILSKLLTLQIKYRRIKIINIFFLGLLFFKLNKIEKEYNKYPKKVELLNKLYLITL